MSAPGAIRIITRVEESRAVGTKGVPRPHREQLILDAAAEEFGRYGYAGAALSRVAAGAGVSKPLVLSYFGSKDGLYVACIERAGANLIDRIEQVLSAGQPRCGRRKTPWLRSSPAYTRDLTTGMSSTTEPCPLAVSRTRPRACPKHDRRPGQPRRWHTRGSAGARCHRRPVAADRHLDEHGHRRNQLVAATSRAHRRGNDSTKPARPHRDHH